MDNISYFRGLRPRNPGSMGPPRPHAPGHFLCGQKVTKKPHKRGTLSMGSLPYGSHPHDDTKGACPLWNPPSQSCGLPGDPCLFYLRGGNEFRLAPRFSPKAKTLVRRTPGGTALYLSCCPSGSPGGTTHQNLSMSQSTFSALGSSLVSTY